MIYAPAQIDALLASQAALIEQQQQTIARLDQMVDLLYKQATRSPWMNKREVADLLGIPTDKKSWGRKVNYLANNGYLQFREGRPRMYLRESVEACLQEIINQRIDYIGYT